MIIKKYFWIINNKETNENKYYFKLNGELLEISKEVYNVCYNSYKKQQRDTAKEIKMGVVSLDNFIDNDNISLLDVLGVENNYLSHLESEEKIANVMNEIQKLRIEDCELITNLLIEDKTERIGKAIKCDTVVS